MFRSFSVTEQAQSSQPAPDNGGGFAPLWSRSWSRSWSQFLSRPGSGLVLALVGGLPCSDLMIGDGGAVVELCVDEALTASDVVYTSD